jgi:hypothetical protein
MYEHSRILQLDLSNPVGSLSENKLYIYNFFAVKYISDDAGAVVVVIVW